MVRVLRDNVKNVDKKNRPKTLYSGTITSYNVLGLLFDLHIKFINSAVAFNSKFQLPEKWRTLHNDLLKWLRNQE